MTGLIIKDRKAKLSYRPVFMVEKGRVTEKEA